MELVKKVKRRKSWDEELVLDELFVTTNNPISRSWSNFSLPNRASKEFREKKRGEGEQQALSLPSRVNDDRD